MLYTIAQVAGSLQSRVTWALLKLLVLLFCKRKRGNEGIRKVELKKKENRERVKREKEMEKKGKRAFIYKNLPLGLHHWCVCSVLSASLHQSQTGALSCLVPCNGTDTTQEQTPRLSLRFGRCVSCVVCCVRCVRWKLEHAPCTSYRPDWRERSTVCPWREACFRHQTKW